MAPDEEIETLMADLSDMQTWATVLCCHKVNGARKALDVIGRTRELIVNRLYQRPPASLPMKG